jgi:hypothetical protein
MKTIFFSMIFLFVVFNISLCQNIVTTKDTIVNGKTKTVKLKHPIYSYEKTNFLIKTKKIDPNISDFNFKRDSLAFVSHNKGKKLKTSSKDYLILKRNRDAVIFLDKNNR